MQPTNLQLIHALRRLVHEQQEEIHCLKASLVAATEWRQCFDTEFLNLQRTLNRVRTMTAHLATNQAGMEARIMATFADMKDALKEQNDAILVEVTEINAAMDALKQDPSKLDEIIADIKANTFVVQGIIETPLPVPDPVPDPVPAPV